MILRLKSYSSFFSLLTLTIFISFSSLGYAADELGERDLSSNQVQENSYTDSTNATDDHPVNVGAPAAEAKENFSGGFKKIGSGFKNGATATGRGFKKAGLTTGRAFKKAGVATGRGFKKFGRIVKNFFTGKKNKSQENEYVEERSLSSSETYQENTAYQQNQDLDAVGNETLYE